MSDSASRSVKRELSFASGPWMTPRPVYSMVVRPPASLSTKSARPLIEPIAPSTRPSIPELSGG